MAGLQHGTTIKTRSLPQDRIVADGGVFDMSTADDDTLMNVATLKDIAEKLSTQKNLLIAKVMAVTNQALTSVVSPYIVDGVTLANGEKVLLTNQTDNTKNGLYTYNSSANTLTFSTEYAQLEDFISIHSTLVTITAGTVYSGYLLSLSSANANPSLGTNTVTFTQIGRLFVQGNGLQFTNGVISGKIDPTTDTGLTITPNGFKLDHNQLPGAGGVPILSVPHPDIHSVTGNIVREVNQTGTITINGGTFRRDAIVTSTGFAAGAYTTRRSNQIVLAITAGNIAGLYDILVTNNTLDSENSGNGTFTVIGTPTLISVSPTIASGTTASLTVAGIGFLPLTTFNNAGEGYTVNSKTYVNPTTYTVNLTIPSTLVSGNYDIQAVNTHASTSTYTSNTSGNDLVQVRNGVVDITRTDGDLDIAYNSSGVITATGTNLYPSGTLSGANIAISSINGTTTSQTINVSTAGATSADIGIRSLTITDPFTASSDVYTPAVAINYPLLPLAAPVAGFEGVNLSKYTFTGTEIEKNVSEFTAAGSMINLIDYFRSNYLPSNHFVGKISLEYDHAAFVNQSGTSITDCNIYLAPRGTSYTDVANVANNGNSSLRLFYLRKVSSFQVGSNFLGGSSSSNGWKEVIIEFERITYNTYTIKGYMGGNLIGQLNTPSFWLTDPNMGLYLYIQRNGVKIRNLKVEGRLLT